MIILCFEFCLKSEAWKTTFRFSFLPLSLVEVEEIMNRENGGVMKWTEL
jgi:hypothetical protein